MRGIVSDETRREDSVMATETEFARIRHGRRKRRLFEPANEWEYAYLKDLSSLERTNPDESPG